jgi:hypothetical protein
MELKGSLPRSQEPAPGLRPDPQEFTQHPAITFP